VRNLRQDKERKTMIIKADSYEEFLKIYRNTPNPITGKTPLYSSITDEIIWEVAFEAGKRQAQTNAQQSHGEICPICSGQGIVALQNDNNSVRIGKCKCTSVKLSPC
jgi:hypothetical protein